MFIKFKGDSKSAAGIVNRQSSVISCPPSLLGTPKPELLPSSSVSLIECLLSASLRAGSRARDPVLNLLLQGHREKGNSRIPGRPAPEFHPSAFLSLSASAPNLGLSGPASVPRDPSNPLCTSEAFQCFTWIV